MSVFLVPSVYNDENQVQCPANETCCERTAWWKCRFLLCVSHVHSLLGTGTLVGIFACFAASSCPTAARGLESGISLLPGDHSSWALEQHIVLTALLIPAADSFSSCTTKREQSGNCDSQVCLWVTASLGASFIALQFVHQFRLKSVQLEKAFTRHASHVLLSMLSLHLLQCFSFPFDLFHLKHISAAQQLKLCLCKISDCKTLERSFGIQPVVDYSWHLMKTQHYFSLCCHLAASLLMAPSHL